jgi:hypothetical protein
MTGFEVLDIIDETKAMLPICTMKNGSLIFWKKFMTKIIAQNTEIAVSQDMGQ